MHIVKGTTKNFNDYEVFELQTRSLEPTWWQALTKSEPFELVEKKIEGVVEADDETGLLVFQLTDRHGQSLFTNGRDEIAVDNPSKLLLLLPNIRQAFHANGFKPKLESTYRDKLIIRYKGPIVNTEVTVKIEEPDTEAVEV